MMGLLRSQLVLWWLAVVALGAAAQDGAKPTVPPDPVRVGDRWTYDLVDEITGDPKGTWSWLVTDANAKEIVTRVSKRGQDGSGLSVFDPKWNVVDDGQWRRKPRDGTGFELPLAVGKQWRSNWVTEHLKSGTSYRAAAVAKVVAEESVTTQAGTFATFKVVTGIKNNPIDGAAKEVLTTVVTWYAPAVNHWVRRTVEVRVGGRIQENTSHELIDYSRKP